eukprot:scpid45440/ scgid20626/ Protein RCC2; RCC1-like protein TD-60; Telophase disk protein of 60 kDa
MAPKKRKASQAAAEPEAPAPKRGKAAAAAPSTKKATVKTTPRGKPKGKAAAASDSKPAASSSSSAASTVAPISIPGASDEVISLVKEKCRLPDKSGVALFSGATCWDEVGRSKDSNVVSPYCLLSAHRVDALKDLRFRHIASGTAACHTILVTEDGTPYVWGRNDRGQCGAAASSCWSVPRLLPGFQKIKVRQAACGRGHTLVLTESGLVFAFGDNKAGQLGLGHQNIVAKPSHVSTESEFPMVKVACGVEHSAMIDSSGSLFTFGCPEYGQLGNNTDGKYFITASKMSFHYVTRPTRVPVFVEKDPKQGTKIIDSVCIVDVACGNNHTVVVNDKKKVFTFGFGGYGRLGHAGTANELVPRLLPQFGWRAGLGVEQIACGSTFSMAISENGQIYFWGQQKMTGEATMYPLAMPDFYGWKARSLGCCYKSVIAVADESVIAWGSSPTFGELGFGPAGNKTSAKPKIVDPLDKIYVHTATGGYGHVIYLARDDTDTDKEEIAKLPEFECPE